VLAGLGGQPGEAGQADGDDEAVAEANRGRQAFPQRRPRRLEVPEVHPGDAEQLQTARMK
jgi:hypothetical protein